MASIMNSGDASSFGLANHFELGAKVQIDGQGKGTVLKYISSTTGDLCQVELDNTEFVITVRADRLTPFVEYETESETESKSRSNPNQDKTATNKRFANVQSEDIPEDIPDFVNQQRNKNTLSKTFYDLKLLTSFLHQESINEAMRKADGSNYEPKARKIPKLTNSFHKFHIK